MNLKLPLCFLIATVALLCGQLADAQDGVLIGELSGIGDYGVEGTLYAVNSRTLRIDNFSYRGNGPAGVFWVDSEPVPSRDGRIIAIRNPNETCEISTELPAYSDETVILELPDDITLANVRYFSVWCRDAGSEFGGIEVPEGIIDRVEAGTNFKCGASNDEMEMAEGFPVQEGWNCDSLSPRYQVRWQVSGEDLNVELVARLEEEEYMGFGPSGQDNETVMIGSDVVIAYRAGNQFFATDYYLSSRQQCGDGRGVCPDANHTTVSGTDSINNVDGNAIGNIVRITYTRPLAASDEADRAIPTEGRSFVSWALGPLDGTTPLFHRSKTSFPKVDVMIEFGRPASNACPRNLEDVEEDDEVPGFVRPSLSNVTEITARIGPSGGVRGVEGITGNKSWGIAWYLSPTGETDKDVLIPALAVERGKTYTFKVYGGLVADTGRSAHPLYITDNPQGGFEQLSPEERMNEWEGVYAGIEVKPEGRNDEGGIENFTATANGALCSFSGTLDETKTIATWEEYYKSLNTSCVNDENITENGGTLTWEVPENAPDLLYYQCVTHRLLGYKILVFDQGKVDQNKLEEANGGATLKKVASRDECKVMFDGELVQFEDCNTNLEGGLDLFFTIGEDGVIDTLFRARRPNGGYLGFGWGYSGMVGSNVVIAYQDKTNSASISSYELTSRTTEGVKPITDAVFEHKADFNGTFMAGRFKRNLKAEGLPELQMGVVDMIWAMGSRPDEADNLQQHLRSERFIGNVDLANAQDSSSLSMGGGVYTAHGVLGGGCTRRMEC